MASTKYTNFGEGTLSSAYTVGDTSLVLNSGEGATFPSSGDFIVALARPSEFLLKCTSRSGDTLTVDAAAQEGTTRTNKAIGQYVTAVLSGGSIDSIRSDMSQVGTFASLPSSGQHTGDKYKTTDTHFDYYYNGSVWVPFLKSSIPVSVALPSFSWRNQGSASVVTGGGTEFLLAPALAGNNVKGREITLPARPFTITAVIQRQGYNVNYSQCGLYFTDGTKLVLWTVGNVGNPGVSVDNYNSVTSSSSSADQVNMDVPSQPFVMRVTDNATNFIFAWSLDGINFFTHRTVSRTAWLGTPSAVGYFAQSINSSWPCATKLIDWKQT